MPKSPKANYIFDTTPDVPMRGTKRGHTEVVETVTRRNLDVCCIQEVRGRGVSARRYMRLQVFSCPMWYVRELIT